MPGCNALLQCKHRRARNADFAGGGRQGLTGYAIGKKESIPLSTVHRFLDGENSPTIATLEAIAKALGLAIEIRKDG